MSLCCCVWVTTGCVWVTTGWSGWFWYYELARWMEMKKVRLD
jgi:hypothetical protein